MSATTKTWINGSAPSCEDDDLNGFKEENNNLISGSGQALNTADRQQTHKAVAVYAAGGEYYTDSGAANAYVLSTIGAKVAPPARFVGMRVAFTAGNTNTGASTVNPAGLGITGLKMPDGSDTPAGVITAGRLVVARYDGANFILSIETLYPSTPGAAQAYKVLVLGASIGISGMGAIQSNAQGDFKTIDAVGAGVRIRQGAAGDAILQLMDSAGVTQLGVVYINAAGKLFVKNNTGGQNIELTTTGAGVVTVNSNTIWHAGNLAAGTRGALVTKSAVQAVTSGVQTVLTWDTESYDTDAIHNTVTNNSRLTVPAGISKVRLIGGVAWNSAGAAGIREAGFIKNGGAAYSGAPFHSLNVDPATGIYQNISSPVLNVSPGDYFELRVFQNTGSGLNVIDSPSGPTWAAMELIS